MWEVSSHPVCVCGVTPRGWTVRFPVPARPMSANDVPVTRQGRIIEGKVKRKWGEAAQRAAERLNGARSLPPSIVRVTIPFSTNRRRDPHNYVATVVKPIVDGLVRAGCWPDDNPEYVTVAEPTLVVGTEVVVRIDERLVKVEG